MKEDSSLSSTTSNDVGTMHHSYDATSTLDGAITLDRPDGLMKIAAVDSPSSNSRSVHGDTTITPPDRWQTFAGVAGNILEWYDFAVFGWFSDILGEVFFPPSQRGHSSTSKSFLVFGLAFWMRPIGGIAMGYIGDTSSRKRALVISILLIAFPTFLMGCLPGYSLIGGWAIVLLVVVRLLQGLSVGGQLMSSLVYTLENQDPAHWGLYGSFVMAAATV
jgi:Sugar (and other) transporter